MAERMWTVDEAASELGVSASVIRKRLQRGQMQAQRMGVRMWAIPQSEIERWRGQGLLRRGRKKSP